MYRLPHKFIQRFDSDRAAGRRPTCRPGRDAFTLAELLMALAITSMLTVVLGGIVSAVFTARAHTEGLQDATTQAQAALDRVKFTIAQAGVYQRGDEPTVLGIAVVPHRWYVLSHPGILVVWSGGRNGGMAAGGVQNRLPLVNELVIYTADPNHGNQFVEIAVPGDSSEIAFPLTNDPDDADFVTFQDRIIGLMASNAAERIPLCDRLRRTELPAVAGVEAMSLGHVRFEVVETPDDDVIASQQTTGSPLWTDLPWAQGIAGNDFGIRQATVRIELELNKVSPQTEGTVTASAAVPVFGSASYRYVYRPNS